MPMNITSDTDGQYWVAVCAEPDCPFRARSASFTAVENAVDEHENRCPQLEGEDS